MFENIARRMMSNFPSRLSHFARAIAIGTVSNTTVALFKTNDETVISVINRKNIILGLPLLFLAISMLM